MASVACFFEKMAKSSHSYHAAVIFLTSFFSLQVCVDNLQCKGVRSRENEGTEREAPGPALGICHVHESYF